MVASLSPKKRKKSPEPQSFQGIRRKEEREKEEEWDGFRIRFLRRIRGKRMEERKEEGSSFSVFQRGFSLSRKRKKSSGFKGRRRERRKRKKRKWMAWRMGF